MAFVRHAVKMCIRDSLWASLECTNFSRAKGGLPRDADSRTLAEQVALCRVLGVSRFRKDDRKAATGEDPEEPPAGSVRPEVGGVQDAVAEVVPVAPHVVRCV